jgi:integrase
MRDAHPGGRLAQLPDFIFLSHLAVERNVAASIQNQVKSASLFLYKEVLQIELPWPDDATQARVPKRLPLVLTAAEVERVLGRLPAGAHQFVGGLLYGSGLRPSTPQRLEAF